MERILCCNVLQNERAHKDNIFRHPLFASEDALPWPPENWRELCCWHCCHACPAPPVCLPNSYDRRQDVFHVFGLFCALPCAKAYLVEHTAFASGDRALLLHYMATRFFGHDGSAAKAAPPRHRLKMFGGDLSIEDFRKEHEFSTVVLSPPLISVPEVYERYSPETWPARGCLRGAAASPGAPSAAASCASAAASASAPSNPSLFSGFLKQKRSSEIKAEDAPGTLCVFMKKKKP